MIIIIITFSLVQNVIDHNEDSSKGYFSFQLGEFKDKEVRWSSVYLYRFLGGSPISLFRLYIFKIFFHKVVKTDNTSSLQYVCDVEIIGK